MDFKPFDGLIAEQFQAVAALDQCDAFGRQALKFDRSYFRAILLALALALGLFVVVQLPANAVSGAVKEIDRRPKQIRKVGFEPCVIQGGDQSVEDIRDGASDRLTFGQRSGIGLVVEWTGSRRAAIR